MDSRIHLLITCEHGGAQIPPSYQPLLDSLGPELQSHRAYDLGAASLACFLSRRFHTPLCLSRISRWVVDLNRSRGHPRLFSEATRTLPREEREAILRRYYDPYRSRVQTRIDEALTGKGVVLHLSVHSFTPVLNSRRRRADVGLLYDPSRFQEKRFCEGWKKFLGPALPGRIIRRNYPYLGRSDGLTTHLRKLYTSARYLGVELEINQKWIDRNGAVDPELCNALANTLQLAMEALH